MIFHLTLGGYLGDQIFDLIAIVCLKLTDDNTQTHIHTHTFE